MAAVFLARAEGLGGFERDVAVKLIHAHLRENQELALALLNEARIAAKIRHPNVVPVYDVGEDPAGIFLVMEYVEGDTLSGLQRAALDAGTRIPTPVALRILSDALAGLQGAHEQRDSNGQPLEIVHRDFSPQNILVGTDGVSRLTDFGIAKAAGRSGHTRPGSIKGKVAYMAPEQARGKAVDQRCDVWAAGVVAWELLAGRPLHESEDEVATLLDVVTQAPPDLRTVDPTIPAELADAVASALVTDRQQRCPTAEELRRRLLDASRLLGTPADRGEVAAFMQQLGGGRAITPLPTDVAVAAPPKNADRQSPIARDLETMTLSAYPIGAPGTASARGHSHEMEAEAVAFGSPTPSVRRTGIIVGAVFAMAAAAAVAALMARPTQSTPVAVAVVSAAAPSAAAAPPEPTPPPATEPDPAPAALSAVLPTTASPAAAQIHAAALPRPSAIHRRHLKERRARESSRQTAHALHAASLHPTMANSAHSASSSPPPLAGNPYAADAP
jgi:serine/threonine-protein kinase